MVVDALRYYEGGGELEDKLIKKTKKINARLIKDR